MRRLGFAGLILVLGTTALVMIAPVQTKLSVPSEPAAWSAGFAFQGRTTK